MVVLEKRGNKTTFVTSLYLWGQKLSVRLPSESLETWQAAQRLASEERTSISAILEKAFEDYIVKHGDKGQAKLDLSIEDPDFRAFPSISEKPDAEKLKVYSDDDLQLIQRNCELWRRASQQEQMRRSEVTPSSKGPVKESDINWFMSTRNWSREQALFYLISLGFSQTEAAPQ